MIKKLLLIVVVLGIVWFAFMKDKKVVNPEAVLSFEDCVEAGYPVMESYPRQCKTPDGRTYAEELPPPPITYNNAKPGDVVVENPGPGAVVGKEFRITGTARGWYFEASFPVKVLDKDGKTLALTYATAQGDWMTAEPVPFISELIKIPQTYIGPATIVLSKDNPSDMRELDASISYPITIEY